MSAPDSWIIQQIRFWFSAELFSVGLFAFAGVAIRVGIQNQFDDAGISDPATGYGPFIQMFYAQKYLLPNLVGCFIMSIFIANTKHITKVSLPLFKGLSTGLCGSITTFSTWMNSSVNILFDDSWINTIIMIVLEFWLTWCAFNMGYAAAKIIEERPLMSAACQLYATLTEPKRTETLSTANSMELSPKCYLSRGTSNKPALDNASTTDNCVNPVHNPDLSKSCESSTTGGQSSTDDSNKLPPIVRDATTRTSYGFRDTIGSVGAFERKTLVPAEDSTDFNELSSRISVWREDGPTEVAEDPYLSSSLSLSRNSELFQRNTQSMAIRRGAADTEAGLAPIEEARSEYSNSTDSVSVASLGATAGTNNSLRSGTLASSITSDAASVATKNTNATATTTSIEPCTKLALFHKHEYYFWCILFYTVAIAVWVTLLVLPDVSYYENIKRRNVFRSVALAPFGAWIRWGFTRFPSIKASWPEMNPQTLLANLTAVTVECFLLVYASQSWIDAINDGVCGSCSTVSTFFGEIHNLYFEKGPFVALRYCATTFVLAIVAIQIIRGANSN